MKIYLAGKIPKGDEIGRLPDWRKEYVRAFEGNPSFEFLSPEDPSLDESQPLLVFGHDCFLVRAADVLLVNASDKLGVGTAQEIIIGKYFGKHIFVILPKDTHHRRTNLNMHDVVVRDWIHPFIHSLSDMIFSSLEEASSVMLSLTDESLASIPRKPMKVIDEAIAAYEATHDKKHSPAL